MRVFTFLFFILTGLFLPQETVARNKIVGISILEPENTSRIPRGTLHKMYALANRELASLPWVRLVNHQNYDAVMQELYRQEGYDYHDVATTKRGRFQVAHYQMRMRVNDGGVERSYRNSKSIRGYQAWSHVSFELIHVQTQTVKDVRVLNLRGHVRDARDKAYTNMANLIVGWMDRFMNVAYPYRTEVFELDTRADGKKLRTVLLRGGSDQGIAAKSVFEVNRLIEHTDRAGKISIQKELVGTLVVSSVQEEVCVARPSLGCAGKLVDLSDPQYEITTVTKDKWPAADVWVGARGRNNAFKEPAQGNFRITIGS